MSSARMSSRRVYTGKVLNLDIDRVRFPDGSTGELEIIRHPGASAILPILGDPGAADPQLLLLKQYRYAADAYLYEIPAGRLEPNEAPADCAARELLEETGCTAEQVEHLFTMFTTPGFTDERIHVFLASGLTRGDPHREVDEFMTLETVAMSQALELIRTGDLNDAKSALAILHAARFRV